jgi:hypothetical protein
MAILQDVSMKTFALTFLLGFFLLGCNDDTNSSGDVTSQKWFNDLKSPCDKNSICQPAIMQAVYQGKPVYYNGVYGPLCDPVFYVKLYSNRGEVIKEYMSSSDDFLAFSNEVTDSKTIWSCN